MILTGTTQSQKAKCQGFENQKYKQHSKKISNIYYIIYLFNFKNHLMIKQESQKIIANLAVCGIDPEFIEFQHNKQYKFITSLEFVKEKAHENDWEKYIQLVNGLFLRIVYSENNRPHIVELQFFTFEIINGLVKIQNQDWSPVFIKDEIRSTQSYFYQSKNINIRQYFEDKKAAQALVLCYQTQHINLEISITDIQIVSSDKKQSLKKSKQNQGYTIINVPIIHKNKSKHIIYKKVNTKLENSYNPILLQVYPKNQKKISLSSLPYFCFPEGVQISKELRGFIIFNFILTLQTGQRIYCSCLIFKQLMTNQMIKKLGVKQIKIYCQKALCIVSEYNYPNEFGQILQQLYKISVSNNDIPFYKVVENLVDSLNMVEEQFWGKTSINYTYGGCNITFETNPFYPIVSEKSVYCLFQFLDIDKIVNIFQSMLLQKKIFLISKSKTILGLVTQALVSFLFPFKWEQVLIPILPFYFKEYTQAPVPFIIGIPPNFDDIQYEKQSIIIDLDKNEILNDEGLPPMPDKLYKQLIKRLRPFQIYDETLVKQYLQNPQNTYILEVRNGQHEDFDAFEIRDAFFEFNLSLMKNYSKFWKKNTKRQSLYKETAETTSKEANQIFNTIEFLSDLNMTKIGSFGYKFTETSIFSVFIQTRARELNNRYLNFFEESIEKKKNRKDMKFINYMKIEKFKVAELPEWEIQVGVKYKYELFPSIMPPQEDMFEIVDAQQIKTVVETQQEIQKQMNKAIRNYLEEKSIILQGFYNFSMNQIYPKQLLQLQLEQDLKKMINVLFLKEQLAQLLNQLRKGLTKIEKSKLKRQSFILNTIQKFQEQQETVVSKILKNWDFTEKNKKCKIQIVDIFSKRKKSSNNQDLENNNCIKAQHICFDFQSILYKKTKIFFYQSSNINKQFKRIYVRVENISIKNFLNQIILKQIESFTNYIIEKYETYEMAMMTFQQLYRFRKWLQ